MPTFYRASCSDPLSPEAQHRWAEVQGWLEAQGGSAGVLAPGAGPWSDPDWWLVADPTGGSLTRDSLPILMGGLAKAPSTHADRRAWWSMSDNSLVLNSLMDRGLCRLLHGHPLTLTGRDAAAQQARFQRWSSALRAGLPFPGEALPRLRLIRGRRPGPFALLGGNLTALERLAETPWRPKPEGRFLLVESLSCSAEHAPHRVGALLADPWWEAVGGLVVGRFTAADRTDPGWFDRCLSLLPPDLAVYRLPQVGHGADAWTVPLGERLSWPVEG